MFFKIRTQIKKIFFWLRRYLWFMLAVLAASAFVVLYHSETRFDPVDFVKKNCIEISAQELFQRNDLEGKLVAVSGALFASHPINSELFYCHDFVIFDRCYEKYVRSGKRANWKTDYCISQRCDSAYLGEYKLNPKNIVAYSTPFCRCHYLSSNKRVQVTGILSTTNGVLLAKLDTNYLAPYCAKKYCGSSWITNVLCDKQDYSLFHFVEGNHADLIAFLVKLYAQRIHSIRLSVFFVLFALLIVPFNIFFATLWPMPRKEAKRDVERSVIWCMGLSVSAFMCLNFFLVIITCIEILRQLS